MALDQRILSVFEAGEEVVAIALGGGFARAGRIDGCLVR